MSGDVVERLRKRAADERAIQANNEAVAAALRPQLEAFERRDGTHNTFALRLHLDHRDCAKHDGELAADWDEAADLIASQAAEIERIEKERVRLWNEVRDLKGSLDVEKAATDAMRIERDEARENEDDGLAWDALKGCKAKLKTAERLLAEARAALTPSAETKAAYMGEFYERVEVVNPMHEGNEDDEPETIIQSVPVSWTTIKEIMAAISARTLTNGGENGR